MEESGEAHSDDNKASQDSKKRRLKTPSQINALEKFYDEHKYPSEEMKAELAVELGLTEKQISGWFCHRRLKDKRSIKDEKCLNSRQERLSGVIIQDLGSGLGQDSCGSTKHLDHRPVDLREVESRRLYREIPNVELSHENRVHHMERVSNINNTSSESSSSQHDGLFSQAEVPRNVETSRFLEASKEPRKTGYRPSGYLKVKGEIENAAITAVKRQLGRQYLENGPLLGVDFDPLPPGAFESPVRDPFHEPYYVGNPVHPHSPDISAAKREISPGSGYDLHNSKLRSRDLYLQDAPTTVHGLGQQESRPCSQLRQKSTYVDPTVPFPARNFSMDVCDEPNYKLKKNKKMGSNSFIKHQGPKIASKQTVSYSHEDDDTNPNLVQRSSYPKFKRPSACSHFEPQDMEERRISVMVKQDNKFIGEAKPVKDYKVKMKPVNDMMAGKPVRVDFSQQENGITPSFAEILPRKNHIKGAAMEMPSSFSEDETAKTSSSAE